MESQARWMRIILGVAAASVIGASALASSLPEASKVSEPETGATGQLSFAEDIKPFFKQYCYECHGNDRQKAGINFQDYGEGTSFVEERKHWKEVIEMLVERDMPPEEEKQPPEADRKLVVDFIRGELAKFDCSGQVNPGHVTIRRLNRNEYENTIRDLLGVEFEASDNFPADEVGYGFDNIGSVLSLPPMLMEKYLSAAEMIADQAIGQESESLSKTQRELLAKDPSSPKQTIALAEEFLRPLARRAYRRPVTDSEVARLTEFAKLARSEGDSFEKGVQLAVQAMLVSPHFLFRWELDPKPQKGGDIRFLTDHELASRLSYFIWSSMPDRELFELSDKGVLGQDDVLEAQVKRMLQDPKADALVRNFAGQWLQTRGLDSASPDPELFPEFYNGLQEAMREETERFFGHIMREDRSILELLDADYTFLNEELAEHYGIDGVEGKQFRKVDLPAGSPRGGVLTQGSILTLTSNPTRTSPVNRGKWVLEQILGTPPPPPPPGVTELEEDEESVENATLRQRLEQHRSKPDCAVCHKKMDPIGFAFQNFNAIGAWREQDGKFPIDPSGTLPSGESFNGPGKLKKILKTRETFTRTVIEKMLTYALGRGLEYYDKCAIDRVHGELQEHNHRFSVLVGEIVKSKPFIMKNAKGEQE